MQADLSERITRWLTSPPHWDTGTDYANAAQLLREANHALKALGATSPAHSVETVAKWLRQMQAEIRAEGHAGWGNTIDDVLEFVEATSPARSSVSQTEQIPSGCLGNTAGADPKA